MGVSKSCLDNAPILPLCVPKGPKPDVELPLHSVLSHQPALQLCQQKPYTHTHTKLYPEAALAADDRRQCLEQKLSMCLIKNKHFLFQVWERLVLLESSRRNVFQFSHIWASSFPTVSTLLRLIGWADSRHPSWIWITVEVCSWLILIKIISNGRKESWLG